VKHIGVVFGQRSQLWWDVRCWTHSSYYGISTKYRSLNTKGMWTHVWKRWIWATYCTSRYAS
jgi:hypothetical protein